MILPMSSMLQEGHEGLTHRNKDNRSQDKLATYYIFTVKALNFPTVRKDFKWKDDIWIEAPSVTRRETTERKRLRDEALAKGQFNSLCTISCPDLWKPNFRVAHICAPTSTFTPLFPSLPLTPEKQTASLWDHHTNNLVDSFPAPVRYSFLKCSVSIVVSEETNLLSKLIGVANYLRSLITTKDQGKMNAMSLECLSMR
ncbi:hypothetical protein HAX54_013030 [Datura stramonium]|uniref:Uncharacterized protein n=1 Tax=Datura stramonium TaxID=4076 RepID=A0ABS8Y4E5_DATST|nr:hypothetical protein [Datura stramonium]